MKHAKDGYLAHSEKVWRKPAPAVSAKKAVPVKAALGANVNDSVGEAFRAAVASGQPITAQGYTIPDAWINAFVPKATEAVSLAMNAVLEASNTAFAGVLTGIEKKVSEVQATEAEARFLERQAKILWWLQVKYSPALEKSYRDINIELGAVQMALDFLKLAPTPVPPHVEAVLVEAMRSTYSEPSEIELLSALKAVNWSSDATYPPLTLLAKIGTKDTGKVFEHQTGLAPKTKLAPYEFARWLFRQAQAKAMA